MSFIAALAACQPEPPAVAFVSDRFDIAPEFDGPLCAGNIPYMEARLAWLEEALEVEPIGRVRYNWLEGAGEFCEGPRACAIGHTIYGPWEDFEHELAHVVAGAAFGRATPFLAEGLADAFTSHPTFAPGGVPSEWLGSDPRDLDTEARANLYGVGAHFVRFLLDTRGLAPLKQLYAASDYDDSAAGFRTKFAAAYGESFDDVEAEYLDEAWDVYPPLSGCPAADLSPGTYSGEFSLDCDDPSVLRTSAEWMERPVTLALPERTTGELQRDGKLVRSRWCPPGPLPLTGLISGSLAAGRHTADVATSIDEPKVVRVEFKPR